MNAAAITAEPYIGSNDFWNTVITVVAALVVGAGAAWATLAAARPKRKLLWGDVENLRLIASRQAAASIEILHGGVSLQNPRVVRLTLKNSGRRDIVAADFASGDNSLVFNFHNTILSIISTDVEPNSAPEPALSSIGSNLCIQPGLIKSGQKVSISVLVDGDRKPVDCTAAHIVETPVKRAKKSDEFKPFLRRNSNWFINLIAYAVVAGFIVAFSAIWKALKG
ncbi:hypothetical protein WJ438_20985 [Streptomyces sp. GD-15H]|uniref:hypothetical protein n=1 Tax=Streptomyces sp. GD-15H TaxID=3129112 RepID=UPI003253B4B9